MKAVLPLARSVRHAAITTNPPPSRIPHLEYHILRKLDRPRRPSIQANKLQQQKRHRSSAVDLSFSSQPWAAPEFDNPFLDRESDTPQNETSQTAASPQRISAKSSKVDFIANQIIQSDAAGSPSYVSLGSPDHEISASELLDEANPERLLAWLSAHVTGKTFIGVASNEDFERAFCALDPGVLVEPFKQAQRYMRESRKTDDYEFAFERSLVNRVRRFANTIDFILVTRQEAGRSLTLNLCRHALKCAASVGDLRMASHIWDALMLPNNIQPDIECYNAYFNAHVWNLAYSEIASVSMRNTTRNLELRSKFRRPKNLLGYRVSPETAPKEPERALRARVLALFQEVSSRGLVSNEETFTTLMIGLAKAGDLAGVDSILKSVWNIDVNALNSFDEEEIESPTYYSDSHALRPTGKLLAAIVHSYAINNSAEKAWSLLDYTSRNYAIDIPESVWTELFEWSMVLSMNRSRVRRDQGQSAGKIPQQEVENLYKKMVDVPYNVRPNAIILSIRAKNLRQRRLLDVALDNLRHLQRDMVQHLKQLHLMVETIKAVVEDSRGIIQNGIVSQKFVDFRRDFQIAYLKAIQQHDILVLETKRLLKEDDWFGSDKQQIWPRQRLPQTIEEFQAYLPPLLKYKTRTGLVELHVSQHRGQASQDGPVRDLLWEATQIWHALEPVDLFRLATNLRVLPRELEEAQSNRVRIHMPLRRSGSKWA